MNRQFDNRFDELFNEKFKDFDKNPPDYILDKIKASVEKQSLFSKIGNYYKNNLFIAGLSIIIPALIIGFYAFKEKKDISILKQIDPVTVSVIKKDLSARNSETVVTKEINQNNPEYKINKSNALFINEETCGLSFNLHASSNHGKWSSLNKAVVFSDVTSASALVNVPDKGLYSFTWTPVDNTKSIENFNIRFINQVKNERIKEVISCSDEVALDAGSSLQSGIWTAASGVVFKNVNTTKTTAIYSGSGKVNMIWTNNSKCALADTFSVIFAEKADASFEISESAKCFDSPVILTAKNKSMARYEWDADNGIKNNLAINSISISWTEGLKHKVALKVWTKENCYSSSSLVIEQPAPIDIKFNLKAAQCENNGSVNAVSANGKSDYQYFWMNDNKSAGPFKDALLPGKYEVMVRDNNACNKAYSFEISGTGALKASFYHSNYDVSPPSTIYFVNTTTENNALYENSDAIKFEWDFGDGQKSEEESPSHLYLKAGNYLVKLVATNKDGCSSTCVASDIIIDPSRVVIPNVFSPNGDGTNDVFKVNSASLSKFHASVSNTKGEMVYEWSDPDKGWDGTILKSSVPAATGVYFYIVKAVGKDGKQYEDKGAVQLVRE